MAPYTRDTAHEAQATTPVQLGAKALPSDMHEYYGWRKEPVEEFVWRRTFKPIGQGGFGAVYREECIKGSGEGALRAVKVLQKPTIGGPVSLDYGRELQAIARFSQSQYKQYFVQSSGWYETDDVICLAMELVQYGSLQRHIGSGLPESDAKAIVGQVLQGLSYMHEAGYTHRDLKPANLLVVQTGPAWHVKIADFGLSKRVTESLSSLRTNAGTPGFAAPEILGLWRNDSSEHVDSSRGSHRQSYTNAVDIWAVGAISYLLLTAALPFPPQDWTALRKYIEDKVPFPVKALHKKDVSDSGCAFIECFMAPDPTRRPSAFSGLQHSWLNAPSIKLPSNAAAQSSRASQSSLLSFSASARWTTEDSGSKTFVAPLPDRKAATEPVTKLGAEDEDTLQRKHVHAHLLYGHKEYDNAETLFREVALRRVVILGIEHKDTIESNFWLARTLYKSRKYVEAERLFRESLVRFERILGMKQQETLESRYWVASTLHVQRKYVEAQTLYL